MKKTLIALVVAASAAVSGSAMAWTPNGTGGTVHLGGTLTSSSSCPTPWEVLVDGTLHTLDSPIEERTSVVHIPVEQSILFLGIRTQQNTGFYGASGISPQINYGGKVDLSSAVKGKGTLTLEVQNQQSEKIGTLVAPYTAVGIVSFKPKTSSPRTYSVMGSSVQGSMFYRGLPTSRSTAVQDGKEAELLIGKLSSQLLDNFNNLGTTQYETMSSIVSNDDLSNPDHLFSGAYGAGINAGENITINLDSPVNPGETIKWKASLPVIVTYA
ncbi:fimbrial protein [Escherichia coli]|uniref:F4 family fimbrial subunit n=1 Tax=Escherichia coli TaxID=562 RepID=UPI000BE6B3FF|nr:fimbrial protein [Escherichia coli]